MAKNLMKKLKEWMKTCSDVGICPQKLNTPMKIR
jgi:hypothetical protein